MPTGVFRLEKSSKVFDLFRLILQYHDPELCTWLDSMKVQPQQYAKDWFSSLLSKDTSAELCWVIWDQYFDKASAFAPTKVESTGFRASPSSSSSLHLHL